MKMNIEKVESVCLAEGAFGEVSLHRNTDNGTKTAHPFVVIKSIRNAYTWSTVQEDAEAMPQLSLRRTAQQEVSILQSLTREMDNSQHSSIVPLIRVEYGNTDTLSPMLKLIMPYCPIDLAFLLHNHVLRKPCQFATGLEVSYIRRFAKDILSAVEFCHGNNIIHGDIKPSNFMLSQQGVLQLTDFGLAKWIGNMELETDQPPAGICTLHYRPPELLFGVTNYGCEIDLFSAGLVLTELYNLCPLLPGNTCLDQAALMISKLGTPKNDTTTSAWPDYNKVLKFEPTEPLAMTALVPRCLYDELFGKLVAAMLSMDPLERPTAKQCLEHSWFLASSGIASRLEIIRHCIPPCRRLPLLIASDTLQSIGKAWSCESNKLKSNIGDLTAVFSA